MGIVFKPVIGTGGRHTSRELTVIMGKDSPGILLS
jgi:hypothetical protein